MAVSNITSIRSFLHSSTLATVQSRALHGNTRPSAFIRKIETHYDKLKVTRDAPEAVIRAAYKALIQIYHPENFAGREYEVIEIVQSIRESYEVLINPESRAEHDRWIDVQMTGHG